ncbi:histidinolphosphatase [Aspergillus niger]|nr:histidinolphosphatase [Aspergillus niger]
MLAELPVEQNIRARLTRRNNSLLLHTALFTTLLVVQGHISMPFTHHSHSGQFCPGHAKDNLEEIIQLAISKKFHTFCLTEHMPRHEEDFYPEEIEAGDTESSHVANEAAYFAEATRLRTKYADQINILIGFEIDWIRPASRQLIEESLSRHPFEFFMGSVHHTLTVPIDYDRPLYEKARALAGGTDELLFEAYFDEQLDMLKQVKPVVVGHFDLIRLKSDDPDRSFQDYPRVWEKILRNLDYVAGYGGLLEVNSAALRKGMKEPYPNGEICKEFLARGGRFCLSDDSHGLEQVGLNFHRVVPFLEQVGVSRLHYLALGEGDAPVDARFPRTQIKEVTLEEVKNMSFWR